MNKLFMGLLALSALALIVSQAIAGANNTSGATEANATGDNGGVVIIETYTASAVTVPAGNNAPQATNSDNAASEDSSSVQPVVVEEGMLIQQTEADD